MIGRPSLSENFAVIALLQVRRWEFAPCLWRWEHQNPLGDELKTPGIQSVGCLMTPDARADKRRSRAAEEVSGSDRG